MIIARDQPSRLAFAYGSATRQGARESQQDAISAFERDGRVYVALADGVGGRPGGAEAAGVAVDAALSFVTEATGSKSAGDLDLPGRAMRRADIAVSKLVGAEDGKGPACTLVVCVFAGDCVRFASVGDTHVIRFRGDEIHRLSIRQTVGVRTRSWRCRAARRRIGKRLARCTNPNALTDALTGQGTFTAGQGKPMCWWATSFLLCSDGLETLSLDALSRSLPALMKTMKNPDSGGRTRGLGDRVPGARRSGQRHARTCRAPMRSGGFIWGLPWRSAWRADAADGT
jgi:serine/threonine protein phosphatase PrpC